MIWLMALASVIAGGINWQWGYRTGREHGRQWGARR